MTIVAFDLGSRRIGCVATPAALPLHILIADVEDVPPIPRGRRLDVGPVVDKLVARVLACKATTVLIEHGMFWVPCDATPQEAARRALAHEICSHLEAGIYRELEDGDGGPEATATWAGALPTSHVEDGALVIIDGRLVEIATITRARWSHRVVPHHAGSITDAQATEGLRAHVAEGWELLTEGEASNRQDRIDAAGTIAGWLLPQPKKLRKARGGASAVPPGPVLTLEQKIERRRKRLAERARMRSARNMAALEAAGCVCFVGRPNGGGRHKAECPRAPPAMGTGKRAMSLGAERLARMGLTPR